MVIYNNSAMTFIDFLVIITGAANFFLGYLVLVRGVKDKVTYTLSGVGFIGGIWAILLFLYHFHIGLPSLLWIKIVYSLVFVMTFNSFYFSLIYPPRLRKSIFLPSFLYLVLAIPLFYTLFFTELWVKDIVYKSWGPETILGPIYIFVCVFWGFFGAWALYNFFRKYLKSAGINRERIKYILIGMFLFISTVATVDGIIPILSGNTKYFRVSPLSSLFVVGFTAYAILRYRLMNIRVVVGRTAIYLFSFVTVIAFGFLLIYLNNQLSVPVSFKVIGPLILVLCIIFFQLFFKIYGKLASRYFYYTFYSYQKVLTNLAKELTQILELDRLANLIVKTLVETMKLDRTVVLLREEKGDYTILKNIGFREENGISLVKDNFLTRYLAETKKPLVYEELSLIQRDAPEGEKQDLEKLKQNMKRIEADLCLPLFQKEKIIGIIVLGTKVSADAYSKEDLELLTTLSAQASISLQNASRYHQVQDLSQNLQEKVAEQTKELQEAYEELKKIDRAKSEFISMASHQLRTPLSSIKGYISMILEGDYGKIEKRAKEKLENVFYSNERLIRIVNDLLDISKIELGKMELKKSPCQIEDILDSCYQEMKPEIKKKNLRFIFKKPETPLAKIEVDELKIRQVILNLIDNAIRYTRQGKIELCLEKKPDSILIFIRDTGEGLTKEEQKEIFQGFTRGSAGIDFFIEGAGLGLYVAKKYLDLHNGKIWAESKGKGKGSVFYVELPI